MVHSNAPIPVPDRDHMTEAAKPALTLIESGRRNLAKLVPKMLAESEQRE